MKSFDMVIVSIGIYFDRFSVGLAASKLRTSPKIKIAIITYHSIYVKKMLGEYDIAEQVTVINSNDILVGAKIQCTELCCHSFSDDDICRRAISRVDFKLLSIYADGMKNEYEIDRLESPVRKIYFWGWIFDKQNLAEVEVEIIPFAVIEEMFATVRTMSGIKKVRDFPTSSAIVLLRHWGADPYLPKSGKNVVEGIVGTIRSSVGNVDNIILKSDPRVEVSLPQIVEGLSSYRYKVESIDNFFEVPVGSNLHDFPAEVLFDVNISSDLFAFDSSFIAYVAAVYNNDIKYVKDYDILHEYFELDGVEKVKYYSDIFEVINSQIRFFKLHKMTNVPCYSLV